MWPDRRRSKALSWFSPQDVHYELYLSCEYGDSNVRETSGRLYVAIDLTPQGTCPSLAPTKPQKQYDALIWTYVNGLVETRLKQEQTTSCARFRHERQHFPRCGCHTSCQHFTSSILWIRPLTRQCRVTKPAESLPVRLPLAS